jgi:hypothetical protein
MFWPLPQFPVVLPRLRPAAELSSVSWYNCIVKQSAKQFLTFRRSFVPKDEYFALVAMQEQPGHWYHLESMLHELFCVSCFISVFTLQVNPESSDTLCLLQSSNCLQSL